MSALEMVGRAVLRWGRSSKTGSLASLLKAGADISKLDQDTVIAPRQQLMYSTPPVSLYSQLIPLEEFARKHPMFDQLVDHPLIPNEEAASLLSGRWQRLIHSMARIGQVNLAKGCTVAESYHKSNVLVHERFDEAYLARPVGRGCKGMSKESSRMLTYGGLARLLEEIAASHQPTARRPKDYDLMVQLMRSSELTKQLEEVVVYHPCLLPPRAYASYIYHIDHLGRRYLFRIQDSDKAGARKIALKEMSKTVGQDGQRWLDSVMADRFLHSIFVHILGNGSEKLARRIMAGHARYLLPKFEVARGASVLNVGRSQLVHGWTPSILKDKFINPSGMRYTLEELVQHQRWRLPGLGHSAAIGFGDTTEHEATGLRSFFPPAPIYHLEEDE